MRSKVCSTAESVKTVSPCEGLPQFWLILFIFIKMGTITVAAESPASPVPIPAPSAATTHQKNSKLYSTCYKQSP